METNQTLAQLTQQIEEQYSNSHSYVIPTEQIKLTENGLLHTGKNEFPLSIEGYEQFARRSKIPPSFLLRLPTDLQAPVFNHCFQVQVADGSIGRDIRINLNKEKRVIGFDDPKLLKINAPKLMQLVITSLPKNLSAEQVTVSRLYLTTSVLSFSCFSPDISKEPRVEDVVNGGIDVHHSTSGEFGIQIRCYLRRKVCTNGACTHICEDEKQVRARRLSDGRFDEEDMIRQTRHLLIQVWQQLDAKLEAITALLDQPRVSPNLVRGQRTRFSLNNRTLEAIEAAVDRDELGVTNTQYDWFNAISRVASHETSISLRQQRRLMFMAGELSQQNARMCEKCGSWLGQSN